MGAIDTRRLQELLAGERFVSRLLVLENTPSTNDEALRQAANGAPEGTVVIADSQSAGRGRHGRSWHSQAGAGVYFSVLFRPTAPLEDWTRWTVGSALAICDACRSVSGCDVVIKWPNDLLLDGRKVAGILAEVRSAGACSPFLVIGVGVNANHEACDFPLEIRDRALSLRMGRGGASVERENLAARSLLELARVSAALQQGEWDLVRNAWSRRSPGAHGRRVRVDQGEAGAPRGSSVEGTTRGLDGRGALLVERETGELLAVHAAGSVVFLET